MTAVIPIIISVAAFGLSALTWREGRSNDRRDLFLRIDDRLMEPDLQNGRHILAQAVRSAQDADKLVRQRKDYELVCRALTMLDAVARYVELGYIDKSLFVEQWGSTYVSLREKTVLLVAARRQHDLDYNNWSWPNFQALADALHTDDTIAP